MITKSQAKRKQDIKTKLMAAIAMLLVSSIMMVSSTYAWFTLSTAPEVTGINTQVGANGNLEIALLPQNGDVNSITSSVGDGVAAVTESNRTWGNVVDLRDSSYGLDNITLYPSALNVNAGLIQDIILKTPTYGSDGRVDTLTPNTSTGVYVENAGFVPGTGEVYGVRGIGTSSSMTPRQLAYRNARSSANTAMAQAALAANASLEARGDALANIAIQYGMNGASATYDGDDIATLQGIIDDLKGTTDKHGILQYIEDAYKQYILAYAASGAGNNAIPDVAYSTVNSWITEEKTLAEIVETLTETGITVEGEESPVTVVLPTEISTGITAYNTSVAAVDSAVDAMPDESDSYTWGQISPVLNELANPAAMRINGYSASEVKANLGAIVSSVTAQGGLNVTISTGGGVYADVADQCGNYSASVNIEKVEYNGIVLEDMAARMNTASNVAPSYLTSTGNAVAAAGAPASSESSGDEPLTDLYGYIIDLAFRTNAASSNLLLQADPIDRIYGNDNTNEETMGSGSSMTFKSAADGFTDNQVLSLMDAIRVVFFNPNGGKVICNAVLDTANATTGENGITAKLLISGGESGYRLAGEGETATHIAVVTYRAKLEGETGTHVVTNMTFKLKEADEAGTHIADEDAQYGFRKVQEGEEATHVIDQITYGEFTGNGEATHVAVTTYRLAETGETATHVVDSVVSIMPLNQNQAHALSVLVYLDGELVGNDDVAATAATSMTGKMNLQFASSATLTPMEYADLHIPAQGN